MVGGVLLQLRSVVQALALVVAQAAGLSPAAALLLWPSRTGIAPTLSLHHRLDETIQRVSLVLCERGRDLRRRPRAQLAGLASGQLPHAADVDVEAGVEVSVDGGTPTQVVVTETSADDWTFDAAWTVPAGSTFTAAYGYGLFRHEVTVTIAP